MNDDSTSVDIAAITVAFKDMRCYKLWRRDKNNRGEIQIVSHVHKNYWYWHACGCLPNKSHY